MNRVRGSQNYSCVSNNSLVYESSPETFGTLTHPNPHII